MFVLCRARPVLTGVAPRDVYKCVGAAIVHAYGNTCRPLVGRQEPTGTYARDLLTIRTWGAPCVQTDAQTSESKRSYIREIPIKIPTFLPPSGPRSSLDQQYYKQAGLQLFLL